MRRKLAVLVVAGLVLAPAASAKGPHVMLSSGPDPVEAGRPWLATIELNEFPRAPHPRVVAARADMRVTAELRRVAASIAGAAGFKLRMVFPTEGRWRLAVVTDKRRFAFPALDVGGGEAPQEYVAFPNGSGFPAADGPGTSLPPERFSVARPSDDGGGLPLWIPAVGIALAGAGLCTFRARR